MRFSTIRTGLGAVFTSMIAAGAALAQDGVTGLESVGRPHNSGTGFQPAVTELARDQQWLDDFLLYICIGVTALVVTLLIVVILRFNSRSNPKPATFTHNSPLEVTWTLIPILILVTLGSFSLPVLFKQMEIPEGDIVIKATGHQWYWNYEYVDEELAFDSYMIGHPATIGGDEAEVIPYVYNDAMGAKLEAAGYARDEFLLAVDNAVVVPVNRTVVVQVTATDVIHAWTIPAFAVKQDAVPGRIAELWFRAEREGVYFGQCSELCGKDHAYMPIAVKVVSDAEYDAWLGRARELFADASAPVTLASAD